MGPSAGSYLTGEESRRPHGGTKNHQAPSDPGSGSPRRRLSV